jgi:HlyD family secretion protein
MKRSAKLGAVLLVGLGIVGGWVWLHPRPQAGLLTLQGNVDVRQADLAFKVAGRIVRLDVEEGDRVVAGQRLGQLEPADYEADLALADGQVAAAEAALAELVHGSRPAEVDQARAGVAEDEAMVVNARLTWQRQQDLLRSGNTPQSSFDAAQASLHQAEARLAAAKATLSLAIDGPRSERIDAARAQLAQARANRALAAQRLADTALVAPDDAVMLSRVREPGTIAAAGDIVFTAVLVHPTWVRAYVGEPDLEKVRPGTAVRVVTEGGRRYPGRIGYVSPLAEFTPKTVETAQQRTELVYRLRVVVDQADEALRQGMPVTVQLVGATGT